MGFSDIIKNFISIFKSDSGDSKNSSFSTSQEQQQEQFNNNSTHNTVPCIQIDRMLYRNYSYAHAMLLVKKLKESADIVNNTANAETFFKRLYFILNNLIFLAQFEKKIKFKGERPSTTYLRTVNNLDKTVDDFIERAYNAELSKIVKLKTDLAKQKRVIKFFSDLEYNFEYCNDFIDVCEIDRYYRGNLYTQKNIDTISELKEAAMNSFGRDDITASTQKQENKTDSIVENNADEKESVSTNGIAYTPYHIFPSYELIIDKNDLKYEYSGTGDFNKSDFYSISINALNILQNLVDGVNVAVQKEVDNNRLPSSVICSDDIIIDTSVSGYSKLCYHPLNENGKANRYLYTVHICAKDTSIRLFFDKDNNIINAKLVRFVDKKEIIDGFSKTFSYTMYNCILRNGTNGLIIRKVNISKNGNDEKLFDDEYVEYQKIVDLLGDKAPKSYSGYMRMKNQNTKNFQKIKEAAEQNGVMVI